MMISADCIASRASREAGTVGVRATDDMVWVRFCALMIAHSQRIV